MSLEKQFEDYLIEKGYKVETPSGQPSTVYDYIKRINKVCKWENMTWDTLAQNINSIVTKYDIGGSKEDKGAISHNSVINALKRYSEFLQ